MTQECGRSCVSPLRAAACAAAGVVLAMASCGEPDDPGSDAAEPSGVPAALVVPVVAVGGTAAEKRLVDRTRTEEAPALAGADADMAESLAETVEALPGAPWAIYCPCPFPSSSRELVQFVRLPSSGRSVFLAGVRPFEQVPPTSTVSGRVIAKPSQAVAAIRNGADIVIVEPEQEREAVAAIKEEMERSAQFRRRAERAAAAAARVKAAPPPMIEDEG